MASDEWQFVRFTFGMAVLSTLLLIPPGLAVAWALARGKWRGKALVETLVTLPLVLPPVVTGLVLLKLLGRRGIIGKWAHDSLGIDMAFTWRAVVVALAIMSFPLFVRAARTAFEGVNSELEQIANTLGAGIWKVFFTITVPLAKRGLLAGVMLAFARALGEFGATITVAGNIPGQTTTTSVAVYQHIQTGEDSRAWMLAGISAVLAFAAVLTAQVMSGTRKET
jgi:molybdate transport system permease protein